MKRLLIALLLCSCAAQESVTFRRPTPEERLLREQFIEQHPDLPAFMKAQIRGFQTTPEDALRRVQFVRARSDVSSEMRRLILYGNVSPGMQPEHVRASWGDPADEQSQDGRRLWRYPAFSARGHDVSTEVVFESGVVVLVSRR